MCVCVDICVYMCVDICVSVCVPPGRREPDPTLSSRAGPRADYPEARPDRLTAVMWSRRLVRSETFARRSVGVGPNKALCQLSAVNTPPYSFEHQLAI